MTGVTHFFIIFSPPSKLGFKLKITGHESLGTEKRDVSASRVYLLLMLHDPILAVRLTVFFFHSYSIIISYAARVFSLSVIDKSKISQISFVFRSVTGQNFQNF